MEANPLTLIQSTTQQQQQQHSHTLSLSPPSHPNPHLSSSLALHSYPHSVAATGSLLVSPRRHPFPRLITDSYYS